MYYRLKENYLLRGWEKLPYALVDKKNGSAVFMGRKEMDALKLCTGKIDTGLSIISEEIRRMLPEIEKNGFIEKCTPGSSIEPGQEYRKYNARYIRTAHWSVTGKCNLKCRHCYMSAPDAKYGELDHETVMNIIRQLSECGIFNVSLTGGEPLVRSDFMEIVDALLERNINITTIYSNGVAVTDRLLDELDRRGIHPEFNMSFDGVGWHDWLRGVPGAEKKAEEAFLRCREKGFPTGAEMCIHQKNKHTLRETVNALAGWGCRSLKTNPVSNVGAWKEGGYGEAIGMDEMYQLYLDYIPHYYEDGMPLSIQLGGSFYASPRQLERHVIPSRKDCDAPEKMCICGHARMTMYISAQGRVLPCMSLSGLDIQKDYPLITEQGLSACITDSTYMRLIDTRVSEYMELHPECAACEYSLECCGGCRAAALDTTPGDIMGRDEYVCKLFKGGWADKIGEAAEQGEKGISKKAIKSNGFL